MPLSNDKEKMWFGWLAEGLGGQDKEAQQALIGTLQACNMPKTSIRSGNLNMWWRPQSAYVDLTCELDGKVNVTIHLQPFGSYLWVGRAVDGSWIRDNYYKRMATQAFLDTVDHAIVETLEALGHGGKIKAVRDRPELGEKE
jgi:hypothetical protein